MLLQICRANKTLWSILVYKSKTEEQKFKVFDVTLTRNSSRMKYLALTTSASSPESAVAEKLQNYFFYWCILSIYGTSTILYSILLVIYIKRIFTFLTPNVRTKLGSNRTKNIDGAEVVRVSHNAISVTRMPLATIALLCKQTPNNFRTRPAPERPMAASIGLTVIICASLCSLRAGVCRPCVERELTATTKSTTDGNWSVTTLCRHKRAYDRIQLVAESCWQSCMIQLLRPVAN